MANHVYIVFEVVGIAVEKYGGDPAEIVLMYTVFASSAVYYRSDRIPKCGKFTYGLLGRRHFNYLHVPSLCVRVFAHSKQFSRSTRFQS